MTMHGASLRCYFEVAATSFTMAYSPPASSGSGR